MKFTIMRCDRCGSDGDIAWYHINVTRGIGECFQPGFEGDLCGRCRAELSKWWKNP